VFIKSSGLTNAQFEKQIAEKDAKISILTSELDSKNKLIEQLTAELNAARRTPINNEISNDPTNKPKDQEENLKRANQELEIVIEELQEKIRFLENGMKGHSRNGSGRDFFNSPEYVELSKTIQRQRDIINEYEEEIRSSKIVVANQKEMLHKHKLELSRLESKPMNSTNGYYTHTENGTYNNNLVNEIKSANSDNNSGNDKGDDVLLKNGLIIPDEAILIFLLFTFSNFITVG